MGGMQRPQWTLVAVAGLEGQDLLQSRFQTQDCSPALIIKHTFCGSRNPPNFVLQWVGRAGCDGTES